MVAAFAADGYRVSVIGRRAPADDGGDRVRHWTVDVTDVAARDTAIGEILEAHGKLSAVVFMQRLRAEGDKWHSEVDVSLTATKAMVERLQGEFVEDGSKGIVFVSSVAGDHVLEDQDVGYHVAKAGLGSMCRYYAVRLGSKGIRVNVVSPGTTLKAENREFYSGATDLTDLFAQTVPLGRMGEDHEVAEVILFMAGPKASFVTGQVINVDGGVNLRSSEALARKLMGL